MRIRLPGVLVAQKILQGNALTVKKVSSASLDAPKSFHAVYVGETQKKKFVVPMPFFVQPSFQALLSEAEEEFSYFHPMGGLTIPCGEDIFINVTSHLTAY